MLLMLLLSTFALGPPRPPEPPPVSARVACSEATFLESEPIGIVLTFINRTEAQLLVPIDYPALQEPGLGGLWFDLSRAGLKRRVKSAHQVFRENFGGEVPLVPLPAGQEWSTTVYLQRFAAQPGPGAYRLPYTLSLPYRNRPNGEEAGVLRAAGELHFRVLTAVTGELQAALDRQAARLRLNEYWGRRSAIEALSVTTNAAVVPYLVQMVRLGYTDSGLDALSQFPQSEEAQTEVVALLRSDRPTAVVQALGVLKQWKYGIKGDIVQELLSRKDPRIRKATLDYLRAVDHK